MGNSPASSIEVEKSTVLLANNFGDKGDSHRIAL